MFRANEGDSDSPWGKRPGKVEFVVAGAGVWPAHATRFQGLERTGQTGGDEESARWLNERLTACYND